VVVETNSLISIT